MNNTSANPIPFIDFGGSGQTIHFSHANGYPPLCYKPLLNLLSNNYHVLSMLQRPLWPGSDPKEINDWSPLAKDLLSFLDQRSLTTTIAIGHSVGAINSLRAAILDPNRFKALVLIDPVLFIPSVILFRKLIWSMDLIYRHHPLIKAARYRRSEFKDRESIIRGFRSKPIFRYLDDISLQTYIEGITTAKPEGGYKLTYSPDWEMRIYATGILRDMDLWRNIPKLEIPVLLIRGGETDTFLPAAANLFKKRLPGASFLTMENSTHLVPLERPVDVSDAIHQFLQEKL